MAGEQRFVPNWAESAGWDEFEWEQALKYNDHLAARYFRLLDRFGDLPDADEIIAGRIGELNILEMDPAELFTTETAEDEADEPEEGEGDKAEEEQGPIVPGDSLYYETVPVYQRFRQLAFGWCNIHASVMRSEDRFWSLKMLTLFGRTLAYLASSVGDGTYERLNASIALAKRSLHNITVILNELEEKSREAPRYAPIFAKFREYLLGPSTEHEGEHSIRDLVIDYLAELRKRQRNGNEPAPSGSP